MDFEYGFRYFVVLIQVAALPSLLAAVETLREAVKVDNVLVEGVGSCGKTTVIHTLATLLSEGKGNIDKPNLVTLHLGEHTDAKVNCVTVCVGMHLYNAYVHVLRRVIFQK